MLRALFTSLAYLGVIGGVIVCVAGLIMMPKEDRRFKTGYKENEVPTWQKVAVLNGAIVAGLSLLIVWLAVATS